MKKLNNTSLEMQLPDGTKLVVEPWADEEYPGIRVYLKKPDGTDEVVCLVEYNTSKPEGKQLCIGAYAHDLDDLAYYESYNDSGTMSPNV